MADLPETPSWESGVHQLEETERAKAGPGGVLNVPANQLANRTQYLKAQLEAYNGLIKSGELPFADLATAQTAIDAGKIPEGASFSYRSDDDTVWAVEGKNVSGVATPVLDSNGALKTYPSGAAIDASIEAVDAVYAIIPEIQSAPGIAHAWADEDGNPTLVILTNGLARIASLMFGYSVKIVGGSNYYQVVKDADSSVLATFYDDGSVLQNGVMSYQSDGTKISSVLRAWADESGNTALALMSSGLLRAASMMFGSSVKLVGATNFVNIVKDADSSVLATFYDDGSHQIGNIFTYYSNDPEFDGIDYIRADSEGNANYIQYIDGTIKSVESNSASTAAASNPLVFSNNNNLYLLQNGKTLTQLTNDSFLNLNPVVVDNGDGTFYIKFASQQNGDDFVAARMAADASNRMNENDGYLYHVVGDGQSLSVAGGTVSVRNPITVTAPYPYDAFCFNGGAKFDAAATDTTMVLSDAQYLVPMRENFGKGSTRESNLSGIGYQLHTINGNTVLVSSTGASGKTIVDLSAGTVSYNTTLMAMQQGYAIAKQMGLKYHPIMVFTHGNQDAAGGTSASVYKQRLLTLRSSFEIYIQELMGSPSFVLKMGICQFSNTRAYGGTAGNSVNNPIGNAQYEVIRDNPALFFLLTTQYRRHYQDKDHLTDTSYRTEGDVAGIQLAAVLNGATSSGLMPNNFSQTETEITFDVPNAVGDLVIDTTFLTDPGNYGITSDAVISAVSVSGKTVTVIKTGTATYVAYAYTGIAGNSPQDGLASRGNIHDSETRVSPLTGENLYNDLVVFYHAF
ncbi:hypothetical protein [Martelella alba]|uniref:Sialate O-acetylesterase domain-containing protein n=1 Tax=Martelella alba TaxID=2590451 RepID=A0ABY2SR33_9HYPH|nr:hypothetical protein [Martelella alba]TKI08675.1 hypothetical protein FCN80_01080 [Martelella alba]